MKYPGYLNLKCLNTTKKETFREKYFFTKCKCVCDQGNSHATRCQLAANESLNLFYTGLEMKHF